jgi:ParB/RepB/Spo0J family partition protein
MKGKFISIPVDRIISESNRAHGGMGNIDILAESIARIGLQSPPLVVEDGAGNYRVVAGRRRVAAVRKLGLAEITARVIDETGDEALSEIALSENVNRAEMHPLDEAELFKGLLARMTVREIAARYDRSIPAIQHRIRLCDLNDEVKAMYRDDVITLSSASLLASLPGEDQMKFARQFEGKKRVQSWDVQAFVYKARDCVIKYIADDECAACKSRTYNTEPGLFEGEFSGLKDVCFDEACYAEHWRGKIAALIREQTGATEPNIIFDNRVPRFYPKNAASISVGGVEYALPPQKDIIFEPTNKKTKANTAWHITAYPEMKAVRVKYSERKTESTQSEPDPARVFRRDLLADLDDEQKKDAGAKLTTKYPDRNGRFFYELREALLHEIIARRVKEESRENMAALFFHYEFSGCDDEGESLEFEDKDDFSLFKKILGIERIDDIPIDEYWQKIFLFLAARSFCVSDMPDLPDLPEAGKDINGRGGLFLKFAQMSGEEYRALFVKKLREAVVKETGGGGKK